MGVTAARSSPGSPMCRVPGIVGCVQELFVRLPGGAASPVPACLPLPAHGSALEEAAWEMAGAESLWGSLLERPSTPSLKPRVLFLGSAGCQLRSPESAKHEGTGAIAALL